MELFKERLEALLESAELLKHMDESLRGRYFVRQDVGTATAFFPWEHLSEKGREAIREQGATDGKDFTVTGAPVILSGGVALSPSETEAILIGEYALAGGDMGTLLGALHPEPSSVGAEARPNALSGRLKRLAPALRGIGIEYQDVRQPGTGKRIKSLKKIGEKDRHERHNRHTAEKAPQNEGLGRDDGVTVPGDGLGKTVTDKSPANKHIRDDGDSRDGDMQRDSRRV